jgi:hypothetical protein
MKDGSVDKSHLWLLTAIVPCSSLAGLAALLRSDQPIDGRRIFSAVTNSGLFGLAIGSGMIWKYGIESWPLILSVSVLAGLGGNSALDVVLSSLRAYFQSRSGQ